MRDTHGDEIRLDASAYGHPGPIVTLSCHDDEGDIARAVLTSKKARKLARKLIAAADELDGGAESDPTRVTMAELGAQSALRQIRERLDSLEADRVWVREQLEALLVDLGHRRAQGEKVLHDAAEEQNATPVDGSIHYLIPAAWLVDKVRNLRTDIPTRVTFALPTDVQLEDRISTGFDR